MLFIFNIKADSAIMGKSQTKKKTAARRHNPMRVHDWHLGSGKVDGKVDGAKEQQMLPVLKKVSPAWGVQGGVTDP